MMKKFAAYASYLGLAGFGFLLLGLVLYSINSMLTTLSMIALILGIVLVIGYVVLKFNELKAGLTSRSAKFGSNAALTILFIFGILVVVNIILTKFSYRIDTTAAKQFSLADQTRKVLKNLDRNVKVIGFFKSGDEFRAKEMLTEYSHYSAKLDYEFIDPDKKPGIAKNYEIKAYNTIVVESQGKQEKIQESTEEELTNALIKVTREGVKKIFFTTGHGEKEYDGSDRLGMSAVKEAIEDENYETEKILLAQQDSLPSDCTVLVVAGPKSDLFEKEQQMIEAYLNAGGKALFMLDPESPDSYRNFLEKWGIDVGQGIIVDASGIGQLFGMGPIIPIVSQYENHPITEGFRVMTVFPEARSVAKAENVESGITVNELAKTNQQSWAETSPISGGSVSFDDKDKRGPISVLTVAEKTATNAAAKEDKYGIGSGEVKTRLAVFGDSDFATNGSVNLQGNADLFLNTVNWLGEEEDLISVRPKDPEDRRLQLTAKQSKIILYVGVILLPVLIFAAGIFVYTKRK